MSAAYHATSRPQRMVSSQTMTRNVRTLCYMAPVKYFFFVDSHMFLLACRRCVSTGNTMRRRMCIRLVSCWPRFWLPLAPRFILLGHLALVKKPELEFIKASTSQECCWFVPTVASTASGCWKGKASSCGHVSFFGGRPYWSVHWFWSSEPAFLQTEKNDDSVLATTSLSHILLSWLYLPSFATRAWYLLLHEAKCNLPDIPLSVTAATGPNNNCFVTTFGTQDIFCNFPPKSASSNISHQRCFGCS